MNGSLDKLVGNNYGYWKLCMKAYLRGQDLWDLISSDDCVIPNYTTVRLKMCYIKCVCLYAQVHTSSQVI